ncbi:MAG: radical SAM protein [Deltaproteobacteria bacterium]|nr:radical SAM protein [Deltaproteobacteria bacterium]
MSHQRPVKLSDAIAAAYGRAELPYKAQLDVTYRCELACKHCYLDDRNTWPELTTDEWRSVLDQLAQVGVLQLTWSGGDPLQRSDLLELLGHGRRLGFGHILRTHAMAVTDAVARALAEAGVDTARVSVYSLRPEVHDAMTSGPGSLRATLAGIAALRAAGISVHVDAFVIAETIEEIPTLAQHFSDQGVSVGFGTKVHRDHLGRDGLDRLDLERRQRVRAQQLAWSAGGRPPTVHPPLGQRMNQGPCTAGRQSLYISPDGAVWPCVMFPMELGHLRQRRLAEIWRESPQRQQILAFDNRQRTACHDCAGSETCFFCMGEAFKTTGDFRRAPAHFHSRTRDWMRGYEAAHGPTWTAEQWATVPEGDVRPPRPARFVFPIYRPRKGHGARATAPKAEP